MMNNGRVVYFRKIFSVAVAGHFLAHGCVTLAQAAPQAAPTSMSSGEMGARVVSDTERSGENNRPSLEIDSSESIDYKKSYTTHYGFLMNSRQLPGGTGDRIGVGAVQICDATLVGKSCVGMSGLAVSGGNGLGNYTGLNARALVPAGLKGPAGAAVGLESDIETHSPVKLRNGLRIADENQSGSKVEHGEIEDAAIAIVTDSAGGNLGFMTGIQFGEANQGFPQYWPILPEGTLLQAANPNVRLKYGFDLSKSTAGFSKSAIALPKSVSGNGILWGESGEGGRIESWASQHGGAVRFTDDGIWLGMDRPLLNVGGMGGGAVINHGSMVQYTLKGYVACNGADGPCTASPHVGWAAVTKKLYSARLAAGDCVSDMVAVPGATNMMAVQTTPQRYPGDGFYWTGFVDRPGLVTVKLCAVRPGAPLSSAYNIRVLP